MTFADQVAASTIGTLLGIGIFASGLTLAIRIAVKRKGSKLKDEIDARIKTAGAPPPGPGLMRYPKPAP